MADSKNTSDGKRRDNEKRHDSAKPKEKAVTDSEKDKDKFSPGEPDDYNADEFATD